MGSTTNQSMFEALFDRRLKPGGAFADELRAAGYDSAHAVPVYPTQVWVRCLEIARAHRWPTHSIPDAYREIGREFTEGFLETLPGKLVAAALKFMSPASFVRRLAGYFRLGRGDEKLVMEITRDVAGAIDATVHNPSTVPGDFVAGMIDAAFRRMNVKWTVSVDQRSATDYLLHVRWE
ncbi:MAG: DUF2378 family protein [Myxococcota bacterium]